MQNANKITRFCILFVFNLPGITGMDNKSANNINPQSTEEDKSKVVEYVTEINDIVGKLLIEFDKKTVESNYDGDQMNIYANNANKELKLNIKNFIKRNGKLETNQNLKRAFLTVLTELSNKSESERSFLEDALMQYIVKISKRLPVIQNAGKSKKRKTRRPIKRAKKSRKNR